VKGLARRHVTVARIASHVAYQARTFMIAVDKKHVMRIFDLRGSNEIACGQDNARGVSKFMPHDLLYSRPFGMDIAHCNQSEEVSCSSGRNSIARDGR